LKCFECEAKLDLGTNVKIKTDGETWVQDFCLDCSVKVKLVWYETKYLALKEKLRTTNQTKHALESVFENVAKVKDTTASIQSFLLHKENELERFDIKRLAFLKDLFEGYAQLTETILYKKASVEQIQALNKQRTKDAQNEHKKNLERIKLVKNDGLKGEYKDKFERKAVLGLMKSLGFDELKARKYMENMTGQKENKHL